MPLPEVGSQEYEAAQDRIIRKIMDIVGNVAIKNRDLPQQVYVLVHDDVTGEKFSSFVAIQYIGDEGMVRVTRALNGILSPDVSPKDIAERLIKHNPDTPLVVDETTASNLSDESTTWFKKDHFSLQGVSGGTIEVYTPFKSTILPKKLLPPGIERIQLFDE